MDDVKEKAIVEKATIATGVSTFEELREESSKIVDKSLFIKDFWENNAKTVLTTYPRRSGKSINMRMVQSFFRIEVDDKGNTLPKEKRKFRKYFSGGNVTLMRQKERILSPLMISEDSGIMPLQGEYPVIYLDVKNCVGNLSSGIFNSMKLVLGESFREHKYLLQSERLSQGDKEEFEKYIIKSSSDQIKEDEVHIGLRLLSRLLYEHFGERVVVLIDEYDAPINKAYMGLSEDEFQKVIELFREIYGSALKNNDYLAKALVTGVMRIAKANLFSGLNNLGEYNISNPEFAPYYGFTQEEVDMLVSHFSVTDAISKEIKSWYNGYRIKGYEIYNIWSLVKCLNKYQFLTRDDYYVDRPVLLKKELLQSYWEESGNVEFIKDLFKWDIIKRKIDELVSGKSITFPLHTSITSKDFKIIKEVTQLSSNYEITYHVSNIVFSYLMMGGYLTYSDDTKERFKLPNHEITHEFRVRLRQYYGAKYTAPIESFTTVTDRLNDLIDHIRDDAYSKHLLSFQEALTSMLNDLPEFKNISKDRMVAGKEENRVIHGNEDVVHCIMSYIALQLHSVTRFGTEISLEKGRADIAFINREQGTGSVIELKYTEDSSKCKKSAEEGLEQIEEKEYAKQLCKYYDVLLLGIGVSQDKQVAIVDKKSLVNREAKPKHFPSLLEYTLA